MRRWRWAFRRFCPSKTEIFVHLSRETPQKRLRNGWRDGRVLAKVTANASPRGDQRSWGVALPSDQASRGASPARDKGPLGPFSPTLYLKSFHMHDEAVAASSTPSLTFGGYLPYESADSYGPTKKIRYTLDLDR